MKTTRDTLIKACYQYLLDHSLPTEKGQAVSFILVPEGEFKRRVLAREKGFKRIRKEEIIENPMEAREKLPYVKQAKKTIEKLRRGQQKAIDRNKLQKEAKGFLKIVFALRKWCDVYINKQIKH